MTCVLEQSLALVGAAPAAETSPLDLTSLQVVTLVDELERACGIHLTAHDVTRDHFRTRATLRALLAGKGVAL